MASNTPNQIVQTYRGFTLIELLIVMAIITTLSGLTIVAIGAIRRATDRTNTEAIIAQAQTAISTSSLDSSVAFTPTMHPLAATASHALLTEAGPSPRAIFSRNNTLLPTNVESLKVSGRDDNGNGVVDWQENLGTEDHKRVLLPDDRFGGYLSNGDVPLMFGMTRSSLGIIGANAEWIHQSRRVPKAVVPYVQDPSADPLLLITPIDNTNYPDETFLMTERLEKDKTLEELSKQNLQFYLGDHLSQLNEAGAIRSSPEPDVTAWHTFTDPENSITFQIDNKQPSAGAYDTHQRVWIDPGTEKTDLWEPGKIRLDDKWIFYQIRGPELVDSYGNGMLVGQGPNNTMIFMSAGEDGCFMVHPGDNNTIDTAIEDYDPSNPEDLADDDQ